MTDRYSVRYDGLNDHGHLRRFADACSTLAEMAMVSHHGLTDRRFVLFYDDNDEQWIVERQWRGEPDLDLRGDTTRRDELARATDVADAVEAARVRWLEDGQT